jgi:uncharacterized protein involved in exopolysaccharide biosynthesis
MTPAEQFLVSEYKRMQLTWADLGRFLRLYTWPIVAIFLATVLGTYLVLSLYSDKYESSAQLLVKVGRETVDPPATAAERGGTLVSSGVRKEDVASEVQLLTSQDITEHVVDELGADKFKPSLLAQQGFVGNLKLQIKKAARAVRAQWDEVLIALGIKKRLNDREKAIVGLMADVEVTQEKETNVITIKLRSVSPNLGDAILKEWISIYLNRRSQVQENTGVREFLVRETNAARERLAKAETARNMWKERHNLSQTSIQEETLIREIREQDVTQDQTRSEIDALAGQIAETRRLLASTPQNLTTSEIETTNPPMEIYRNELAGLELQRSKLLGQYEPQSERIQLLDEEIGRLQELIRNEQAKQISSATVAINPLANSLQQRLQEDSIRLEGLKERAQSQSVQKRALEDELSKLDSADATLTRFEREKALAEETYSGLVKRENEANIADELDSSHVSNVSVLAPPTSSIEPVYPKRPLIMTIALALGLVLGAGLSLVYELMGGKVRSPDELTRLTQLHYLGSVHVPEGSAT